MLQYHCRLGFYWKTFSLFNDVPIVGIERSVYSPGKNVPNFPCIEKQAFLLLVLLFWGIGLFNSVTSTNYTPVTSINFSVIDAQKQVREPHAVTTTRLTTYRLTCGYCTSLRPSTFGSKLWRFGTGTGRTF